MMALKINQREKYELNTQQTGVLDRIHPLGLASPCTTFHDVFILCRAGHREGLEQIVEQL